MCRFAGIGQNASNNPKPLSPQLSPTQSPTRAGKETIL